MLYASSFPAMTLPKKSRSSIVVDDVTYHWTRGRSPACLWVTVQHGSGHGALLRIDTVGIPMPNDIADGIRFAIKSGWEPKIGGECSTSVLQTNPVLNASWFARTIRRITGG